MSGGAVPITLACGQCGRDVALARAYLTTEDRYVYAWESSYWRGGAGAAQHFETPAAALEHTEAVYCGAACATAARALEPAYP